MKIVKKHLLKIILACLLILPIYFGCIYEPEQASIKVLKVRLDTIQYHTIEGTWLCRDALIGDDSKHAIFPIQYDNDIKIGTQVAYNCNQIVSYKKRNNIIYVDWNNTKQ